MGEPTAGSAASALRTRREVLAAAMAGGVGLALAACSSKTLRVAASTPPAGGDLGAVDHLVFLMMENRSFDHYFGTYRGVRGFSDPSALPGVFQQAWPAGAASHLLPFHLDVAAGPGECTPDLTHAWDAQHRCWDRGAMDQFVAVHTDPSNEGAKGVITMGYYERDDLPFYYALADTFTICDNYHCSVFGPTHPNRLHALSGTLDPAGGQGGPILTTGESPTLIGSCTWETMPQVLQRAKVSWRVYNPPGALYQPSSPLSLAASDNILLYFKQHVSDTSSPLYRNAFGSVYPDDFARDVAHDALPSVSWITPPIGEDEHPPAPPAVGMWYTHQVLSTLVSNPKVWSKTVLVIMYDENDGFFDHVPPPTAPAGTPGEYVTATTGGSGSDGGVTGPIGLGFRVPCLVVSPFSRGGYVCSDVLDHTSQLRMIATRFGVQVPNVSAWRRRTVGDFTGALHATPDESVPSLPATPKDPASVTRECDALQLLGIDSPGEATYPVPKVQHLPTQEPGPRRGVPR